MLQALLNKLLTVTVTSSDETMGTAASNVSRCGRGGTVILKATPNDGYLFDSWSDGDTTATRGVVVYEPVNLTAKFKILKTSNFLNFTNLEGGEATLQLSITLPTGITINPITSLFYREDTTSEWLETAATLDSSSKYTYTYTITFNTYIEIKGAATHLPSTMYGTNLQSTTRFYCNKNFNVSGRLSSLVCNTDEDVYLDSLNFDTYKRGFEGLFLSTKVVSAKNLILPTFSSSFYASSDKSLYLMLYNGLFDQCTILEEGPTIPDFSGDGCDLTNSLCQFMFRGCTSLNKIYSNLTGDLSNASILKSWMLNTLSTGDFYNLGGATFTTGDSGIPAGWTVHTSLDE